MKRTLLLLLALAPLAAAETRIGPPRRGVLVACERLRPLLGISGSLVAGPVLSTDVVTAASSGPYILVKTHAGIEVRLEEQVVYAGEAPPGGAVFGFARGGEPALAYLTSAGEVLLWDGWEFRPAWRIDEGEVLAAAVRSPGRVVLAFAGEGGVRLETRSLSDGRLLGVEALPRARGPVALLPGGGLVYWEDEGLVVATGGEAPLRLALERPPDSLTLAGDGLVVAHAGARAFGIALSPRPRLFELPVPDREAEQ